MFLKARICLMLSLCSFFSLTGNTQAIHAAEDPSLFSKLVSTKIPGAPVLGKPFLLKDAQGPLVAKGMGWASPILLDVNGDGLDDLVIGEFGSGKETGMAVGNFLRVYENTGTKTKPAYDKAYSYLRYNEQTNMHGTPMSLFTWCCMAFTPRLVDLDGDGKLDLAAGQYYPGEVLWYKKINKGYDMGKRIPQTGMGAKLDFTERTHSQVDSSNFDYWAYSTAAFVDLDGDGRQDMITGGWMLRAAMNIGTKQSPAFGIRSPLRDVNGKFLEVIDTAHFKDKKYLNAMRKTEATGTHMIPYVVDWDNDGVEDLLVTNGYIKPGFFFISFYKGIRKGKKLSFQPAIPLFEANSDEKLFPGSHPNICVADWNNDGVKDLIIGTCVTTNYGSYDPDLSWQWEADAKTYKKNPAYHTKDEMADFGKRMIRAQNYIKEKGYTHKEAVKNNVLMPEKIYENFYGGYGKEGIAHDGYVFVLLGSHNQNK